MTLKPIVKWAGGKSRLLPKILPMVPKKIGIYAEPFAGGAALFFALAAETPRRFKHAILSDRNEDLVVTYRAVRDDVEGVIRLLSLYENTPEFFARVRSAVPTDDTWRAARLLYLNRTCFNGLWRVNAEGTFNVPFGKYKNQKICNEELLRAASLALQGVMIEHVDFAKITACLKRGDFAYLDPPYLPKKRPGAGGFTSYAKGGFGPKEQQRLADELVRMSGRGVKAMLSNADTAAARRLYVGMWIRRLSAPRSISCDGGRKAAREILVTTWDAKGATEK